MSRSREHLEDPPAIELQAAALPPTGDSGGVDADLAGLMEPSEFEAAEDHSQASAEDPVEGGVSVPSVADPDSAAHDSPSSRGPRGFHGTTQIALLFGVATAVEWWACDGRVGFAGTQPHPYSLIVLLMAAGRGVNAALLSATVATVLYSLGLLAAGTVGGPLELLQLGVMRQAVLFFAAGFVIGQLRDRLASRHHELGDRHSQVARELEQVRRDRTLLTHANRELQRRVFEEGADFSYLLTMLSNVEAVADPDSLDLPLSLLEDHCGATKCSVLLVMEDGTVDLSHHRGWGENEIRDRIAAASASLQVRRAIEEARPILSFEEEEGFSEVGPLMVAPIADITGVIKALLCIDELPPQRIADSMVGTFLGIAEWVAAKLRRTDAAGVIDSHAMMAQVNGVKRWIGTPEDLSARIFLEDARCGRHGIASTFLALQAPELQARIPGALDRMDKFLLDNLGTQLRYTDDMFRFGYPGCYVFMLTGSQANGADVVRRRLVDQLNRVGTETIGAVEFEIFAPDELSPDLTALLPRITQGFHNRTLIPLEPRCPVPVPHSSKPGDALAFVRRLQLEIELARRHDRELSLIDFTGNDSDIDVGQMIGRHIWNLPVNVLRSTDGVYVLGARRCVVVLPSTGCMDAVRVWQRLQDTLRKTIPQERFDRVQTDFLSLAGSNAVQALNYLVGVEEREAGAAEPILSEIELKELAFTEFEMSSFTESGGQFSDAPEALVSDPWAGGDLSNPSSAAPASDQPARDDEPDAWPDEPKTDSVGRHMLADLQAPEPGESKTESAVQPTRTLVHTPSAPAKPTPTAPLLRSLGVLETVCGRVRSVLREAELRLRLSDPQARANEEFVRAAVTSILRSVDHLDLVCGRFRRLLTSADGESTHSPDRRTVEQSVMSILRCVRTLKHACSRLRGNLTGDEEGSQ